MHAVRETRIFLVDGHRLVRESLSLLLGRETGFAICGDAAWGREALRQVPMFRPDLVLIGARLPDMSGMTLAGELHRWDQDLVLALLAGAGEGEGAEAAFRVGARGYVVRGSMAELVEAVRVLMSGAEYRSAAFTRRPARPVPAQCRPGFDPVPAAPAPGAGDGCAPPAFSGRPRAPRHRR